MQQFDAVAEQLRIAAAADAARAAATAERRREQEAEEEEWRRRQEEEWRRGQFLQLLITQLQQSKKYLELLVSRLERSQSDEEITSASAMSHEEESLPRDAREPPTQRAPIPPIPHPPIEWIVEWIVKRPPSNIRQSRDEQAGGSQRAVSGAQRLWHERPNVLHLRDR